MKLCSSVSPVLSIPLFTDCDLVICVVICLLLTVLAVLCSFFSFRSRLYCGLWLYYCSDVYVCKNKTQSDEMVANDATIAARIQALRNHVIILSKRKSVKYGLPFLLFVVGGSFGLREWTQIR